MVMRLPSRRRCTSLPSLTARRPNVVSAMSACRQNSEIWLRIWSFFMRPGFGTGWWAAAVYSSLPTTVCPTGKCEHSAEPGRELATRRQWLSFSQSRHCREPRLDHVAGCDDEADSEKQRGENRHGSITLKRNLQQYMRAKIGI